MTITCCICRQRCSELKSWGGGAWLSSVLKISELALVAEYLVRVQPLIDWLQHCKDSMYLAVQEAEDGGHDVGWEAAKIAHRQIWSWIPTADDVNEIRDTLNMYAQSQFNRTILLFSMTTCLESYFCSIQMLKAGGLSTLDHEFSVSWLKTFSYRSSSWSCFLPCSAVLACITSWISSVTDLWSCAFSIFSGFDLICTAVQSPWAPSSLTAGSKLWLAASTATGAAEGVAIGVVLCCEAAGADSLLGDAWAASVFFFSARAFDLWAKERCSAWYSPKTLPAKGATQLRGVSPTIQLASLGPAVPPTHGANTSGCHSVCEIYLMMPVGALISARVQYLFAFFLAALLWVWSSHTSKLPTTKGIACGGAAWLDPAFPPYKADKQSTSSL